MPTIPTGIKKQSESRERIYTINNPSIITEQGLKLLRDQIEEAKQKIREIFLS